MNIERARAIKAVSIFVVHTFALSAVFEFAMIKLGAMEILYVTAVMWMPTVTALLTCRIIGRPLTSLPWQWGAWRWNICGWALPMLAEQMLNANPGLNVRVEGHTDNAGADSYNQQLSQRRAQAVVDHLVMKGINRSRMKPKGYGESSPVADNTTSEGRARNRRVDFVINK